jgi:heme-degrading monooxygenase HmoA
MLRVCHSRFRRAGDAANSPVHRAFSIFETVIVSPFTLPVSFIEYQHMEGVRMIARVWHGGTKPEHADAYESHLKPELLPGLSLQKGFRGSYLLRRAVGNEVEFITIILWDSLDDVRAIAGEDYEHAVIPEDRLPLLTRYDARAAHYEVVSTREPAAR